MTQEGLLHPCPGTGLLRGCEQSFSGPSQALRGSQPGSAADGAAAPCYSTSWRCLGIPAMDSAGSFTSCLASCGGKIVQRRLLRCVCVLCVQGVARHAPNGVEHILRFGLKIMQRILDFRWFSWHLTHQK